MLSICLFAALTPAVSPTPSLRQLCIRAPVVVLARPVDATSPTRFTVVTVLRGRNMEGKLRPAGLVEKDILSYDSPDPETKKPVARRIDLAILFLEPAEVDGGLSPYRVVPGGYRFCTDDGRVLIPDSPPTVSKGVEWFDILRRVRTDVAAVDRLHAARRMTKPRQRVAAMLEWVKQHSRELAHRSLIATDTTPGGWSEIGTHVFDWIFDDATPAEAWAAVRLYASLHRGEVPRVKSGVFATPEGRTHLGAIAFDDQQLVAERVRAMKLLLSSMTKIDDNERADLMKKLHVRLSDLDQAVRVAAARLVAALASNGPIPPAVLTTLADNYRVAETGPGRDEFASLLYRINPKEYAKVSGNPEGVCVRLTDFTRNGSDATFFVELTTGAKVYEQPTLVFERLGDPGWVAETIKLPLTVLNVETVWASGLGDTTLGIRLDLAKVIVAPPPPPRNFKPTPTFYRIRVEGTIGKDKRAWRSEALRIGVMPSTGDENKSHLKFSD